MPGGFIEAPLKAEHKACFILRDYWFKKEESALATVIHVLFAVSPPPAHPIHRTFFAYPLCTKTRPQCTTLHTCSRHAAEIRASLELDACPKRTVAVAAEQPAHCADGRHWSLCRGDDAQPTAAAASAKVRNRMVTLQVLKCQTSLQNTVGGEQCMRGHWEAHNVSSHCSTTVTALTVFAGFR